MNKVAGTLWYFVEQHGGRMARLPASRLRAFLKGRERIEPSQSGEVRVVEVMLDVDQRVVQRFLRAWPRRYRLGADSKVAQADLDAALRRAAEMIDFPTTNGAVNLGPHIAKRNYEAEHAWRPTDEQWHAIAIALNRAAAHPPIAVVTVDGLVSS